MKQTSAVEWLIEQWPILESQIPERILEQAKEMFENQIMDAYEHGQNNGYMYRDGNNNIIQAEQYYNKTFKLKQ